MPAAAQNRWRARPAFCGVPNTQVGAGPVDQLEDGDRVAMGSQWALQQSFPKAPLDLLDLRAVRRAPAFDHGLLLAGGDHEALGVQEPRFDRDRACLLYTSDAAD